MRQFDQLAALLEQAYSLPSGRLTLGNLIGGAGGPEKSAAAIAAVILRDVEGASYPHLAGMLGALPSEVQQLVIEMKSRMLADPAVDHAVLRFKFALQLLRDYRPAKPLEGFVMPGPFAIG